MRVTFSMLAGIAAIGLAGTAGAQQRTPEPEKEKRPAGERCIRENDRVECTFFRRSEGDSLGGRWLSRARLDSALMKRAALGVELSPTGTLRDTLGVFVSRVTTDGPAEKAGVVEGDRIVSINGVDLRVNAADAGDRYAAGLPSRRLTREVQKLAPGTTVNLRVYSGGRVRDVRVTLARAYDLRDRNSFGYFFDGVGPGFIMGDFPRLESMRLPLRQFERMRIEDGARGRMPLERIRRPLLRLDGNERLIAPEKATYSRLL